MMFFNVRKPATETYKILQNACGDEAVYHACIFEWFKSSGFCMWAKEWVCSSKLGNIVKVYEMVIADSVNLCTINCTVTKGMWDPLWRFTTEEDLHGFVADRIMNDLILPWSSALDLVPTEFFSLSCSENHIQWIVQDIKKVVTNKLNAVPLDASSDCFLQLLERCEKCVAVKRDYFERK